LFALRSSDPKAIDQFLESLLRIAGYGNTVTYQHRIEVEREQLLHAAPKTGRIVHHALAQQAQAAGGIPYNRVADDQGFPHRPKKGDLAWTLATDFHYFEASYPFTRANFSIYYGALGFCVRGVLEGYVAKGSGAFADLICGAHVISVREENSAYTPADEFAHHLVVGLDRIDA
jgi:hypothetical protein